ncbi:MAG: AraC family transcriptional regulator [Gammaproteobacteria bacterium]
MSETLTPAKLVLMVLYLVMDDMELETVAEHAGIPVARLEDLDGMISIGDVVKLVGSTLELTGDPALGLHVGQEISVKMLDMFGMMVSSAPDARAAIQTLTRYSPLISTLARAEVIEEGDRVRIVLHLHEELLAIDNNYCVEVIATGFFYLMRRLVDGPVIMRRWRSQRPAPAWIAEYHDALGEETEFCFEAGENSVEFDRAILDLPMKRHSPGLYQQLHMQAAKRMASLPNPERTSTSVKRLIDENLGRQLIDLPLIADLMGLNPRTLQRRLKEENVTFQSLHDSSRYRMACDQLAQQTQSVEDIAAMLGYSEPANFYRAFKTWSGVTPNDYRRQYKPRP